MELSLNIYLVQININCYKITLFEQNKDNYLPEKLWLFVFE